MEYKRRINLEQANRLKERETLLLQKAAQDKVSAHSKSFFMMGS
jgi:hypothetical protein